MTRRSLKRTLSTVYCIVIILLLIALLSKLSDIKFLNGLYDLIRDMSLMLVTLFGAYLAHIFQKRATFLQSLREEWRDIVQAKAHLVSYCERRDTTHEDYVEAWQRLSEAIDYMRIVYANVGESKKLIGLYPYEPLHDMRRAFEKLNPEQTRSITKEDKIQARDQIWQAFAALRERFLDEFDLEPPSRPLLTVGAQRVKTSGAKGNRKHINAIAR